MGTVLVQQVHKLGIPHLKLPVTKANKDENENEIRGPVQQIMHERALSASALDERLPFESDGPFSYAPRLSWDDQDLHLILPFEVQSNALWECVDEDLRSEQGGSTLSGTSFSGHTSNANNAVCQIDPDVQASVDGIPLETQEPWSPVSSANSLKQLPSLESEHSTASRKQSTGNSSLADGEHESTSFFSCSSGGFSSGASQFYDCQELFLSPFEAAAGSAFSFSESTCCSPGVADGVSILYGMGSTNSHSTGMGVEVGDISLRQSLECDESMGVECSEQDVVGGNKEVLTGSSTEHGRDQNAAGDQESSSERDSSRRSKLFGSALLRIRESYSDSVSDLLTSSSDDDEDEEDDDEDGAGSPPNTTGSNPQSHGGTVPVVPNVAAQGLQHSDSKFNGNGDGCDSPQMEGQSMNEGGVQDSPSSMSSVQSTTQAGRSTSEESLSVMERVVGLTLCALHTNSSWTDVSSTAVSRACETRSSSATSLSISTRETHVVHTIVGTGEGVIGNELKEESQLLSDSLQKILGDISAKAAATVNKESDLEEEIRDGAHDGSMEIDFSDDESVERGPGHSRELSLEYLTTSNSSLAKYGTLDTLPEELSSARLPKVDEHTESICIGVHEKQLKERHSGSGSQVYVNSFAFDSSPAIPTSQEMMDVRVQRPVLRKFTSFSDNYGDSFDRSAKYRILKWFRRKMSFSKVMAVHMPESMPSKQTRNTLDGLRIPRNFITCIPKGPVARVRGSRTISLCDGIIGEIDNATLSVIEDEFTFDDAEELNKELRNMPEFVLVDMGTWTSKMIGFTSPAKYYAHMASELQPKGIDVLLALCFKLGSIHPLVYETAELLGKTVEDIGKPPKRPSSKRDDANAAKVANREELRDEWGSAVFSTLLQCGINAMFFDRGPSSFNTVSEYYSYLSQKLRSEGVDIDSIVPMIETNLGTDHPLLDALEKCVEVNPELNADAGRDAYRSHHFRGIDSTCSSSIFDQSILEASVTVHAPAQQKKGVKGLRDFVRRKFMKRGNKRELGSDTSSKSPAQGEVDSPKSLQKPPKADKISMDCIPKPWAPSPEHGSIPRRRHRKWQSLSLKHFSDRFLKRSASNGISPNKLDSACWPGISMSSKTRTRNALDRDPTHTWSTRGYGSLDHRRRREAMESSTDTSPAFDSLRTDVSGNVGSARLAKKLAFMTILERSSPVEDDSDDELGDNEPKHRRSFSVDVPSLNL